MQAYYEQGPAHEPPRDFVPLFQAPPLRLGWLEARKTGNPFKCLTMAEFDERIAALIGLGKGEPLTVAMPSELIQTANEWKQYEATMDGKNEY